MGNSAKNALKSSKKGKSEVQVPTDIPKMRFASFYPHCFLIFEKREKRRKKKKTRDFLGFSAVHLFWHRFLVAGMGFEPHDLRVMSPTSYQAALPRDIKFSREWVAGDRARTGTGSLPRDFKSRASACSATPAFRHAALSSAYIL